MHPFMFRNIPFKTSEDVRSCLVSITGDITLIDVSEICSLIQVYSNGSLLVGCRYEEIEEIIIGVLGRMIWKRQKTMDEVV